jgi:beta-carotene 3-hydroxylase
MQETILFLTSVFLAANLMEEYSRYAHKYLWHGPLWCLHKSHHMKRRTIFEANDILGCMNVLLFLPLTVATYWAYAEDPCICNVCRFGACVGADMFGVSYVLIHDGVHHGRFDAPFLCKIPRVTAMVQAHSMHHVKGKEPYGLWEGARELADGGRPWSIPISYALILLYLTGA